MADKKLGAAPDHQIKGLRSWVAKPFAWDRHHDIGILGEETNDSLEAGHEAGSKLKEATNCLALRHSQSFFLYLSLK